MYEVIVNGEFSSKTVFTSDYCDIAIDEAKKHVSSGFEVLVWNKWTYDIFFEANNGKVSFNFLK